VPISEKDRALIALLSKKEWRERIGEFVPRLGLRAYIDEFARIADMWPGYVCLPGVDKKPVVATGKGSLNPGSPEGPTLPDSLTHTALSRAFNSSHGRLEVLLWPASHVDHPLAIYDADTAEGLEWGLEQFGTPHVRTRRGAHWYFRCPTPVANGIVPLMGDLKSWGGYVIAPGSLNGVYEELAGPLSNPPEFPYALFGQVKSRSSKTRRKALRTSEAHSGYTPADPWDGEMQVRLEDGEVRSIEDCEGERVHAPNRKDATPSVTLSRDSDSQRLIAWDPGGHGVRGTKRFVTERHAAKVMAEACERFGSDEEPAPGCTLLESLRIAGLDAQPCPMTPEGWVDVQYAEGLTIIISGHGTGKTVAAKRFIGQGEKVITITNTTFLAEANAEVFGLDDYSKVAKSERVSTTLESLERFEDLRPDVTHIDEVDAVVGFMFSRICRDSDQRCKRLRQKVRQAKATLMTSADLDFHHVMLLASWAPKQVRVFVNEPVPGRRHIMLQTWEQWYDDVCGAVENPHRTLPIAVAVTSRARAESLAHLFKAMGYNAEWMSADNSQLDETIEKVKHINEVVSKCDVFIYSPTLQSGVSITTPVHQVFVDHTYMQIDAETVCQMPMRFRNPHLTAVVWAVSTPVNQTERWPVDSGSLNMHLVESKRSLDILLGEPWKKLPDWRNKGDLGTVAAWRCSERRSRLTIRYPIGRLKEIAAGHGWTLEDLRDNAYRSASIRELTASRTDVKLARQIRILAARDLTDDEVKAYKKRRFPKQEDLDAMRKHELVRFFGTNIPLVELVEIATPSFLKKCKMYCRLVLETGLFDETLKHFSATLSPSSIPKRAKPWMEAAAIRLVCASVTPESEMPSQGWRDVVGALRLEHKALLGNVCPEMQDGVRWLNAVLGKAGYTNECRRGAVSKGEDKAERWYRWSAAHMAPFCEEELARVRQFSASRVDFFQPSVKSPYTGEEK
jgi:hypothetical protein